MNKQQLIEQIQKKKSFLCVGLDTDINKIPQDLLALEDPVFEFNKQIINKTLHELWRHGLEIYRVGHILRRLYRSNIWIDEHGVDAFLLQCLQRLGTAIVELASLTNLQCAAT